MRAQLDRRHHPVVTAMRGAIDRWRHALHGRRQEAGPADDSAPAAGRGLRFTRGEIREFLLAYCACFVAAMAFLA